jgi:hypothetical protein
MRWQIMRTGGDGEWDAGAAFELAAGCVAVVAAAFLAAAAFGPAEQADRAVLMAICAGGLAAVLRDWRALAGVTVIAALLFVGFLAHQAGQLTGDPAPWRYTLIIGFAALLGRGQRWIRAVVHHRAAQDRAVQHITVRISVPNVHSVPDVRPLRRRRDRSHAPTSSTSVRS